MHAGQRTYQVGAHFEALDEGLVIAPFDFRYTQVGFNLFKCQNMSFLHLLPSLLASYPVVVSPVGLHFPRQPLCPRVSLFQALLRRDNFRPDSLHALVGETLGDSHPFLLQRIPCLVGSGDVFFGE